MTKLDIYIKDEGYASIKFLTLKAKEWAHANGIYNVLNQYDKFCGQPIWKPGMKKGLYHGVSDPKYLEIVLMKQIEATNLKVESEL